jgi:hypothetical protein
MVKLVTLEGKLTWLIDFSPVAMIMIACDPAELPTLREDIDLAIAKQIVDKKAATDGLQIVDAERPEKSGYLASDG